ncbi:MAG TPA: hypothetical protein VJS44_04735 [Pyrinomonadaceae bacterium]|nr:hypothetical protein [Pyrinomonadaceae bacterium]
MVAANQLKVVIDLLMLVLAHVMRRVFNPTYRLLDIVHIVAVFQSGQHSALALVVEDGAPVFAPLDFPEVKNLNGLRGAGLRRRRFGVSRDDNYRRRSRR